MRSPDAAESDSGSSRPARTVAVLTAGIHRPSTTATLAARLAQAVVRAGQTTDCDVAITTVEIRDHAVDLATSMVTGMTSSPLSSAIEAVTHADGLIAVTPTFASSYAGMFKSFFDVLDPVALAGMPTLLGATGGSVRHSLIIEHALRPLLGYFRAAVVPTGVFATPEELTGSDGSRDLADRIERAGGQLAQLIAARAGHDRR